MSVNLLVSGDMLMGIGTLVTSLFFMSMMIRHFLRVKKERGTLKVNDCLRCNTSMPMDDSKAEV